MGAAGEGLRGRLGAIVARCSSWGIATNLSTAHGGNNGQPRRVFVLGVGAGDEDMS